MMGWLNEEIIFESQAVHVCKKIRGLELGKHIPNNYLVLVGQDSLPCQFLFLHAAALTHRPISAFLFSGGHFTGR